MLKMWLESYFNDEEDGPSLQRLRMFAHSTVQDVNSTYANVLL